MISGRVVYLVPSEPGNSLSVATLLEPELETKYLGEGYRARESGADKTPRTFWRMQVYRTMGVVAKDSKTMLRIYVVEAPQYPADAITDSKFRVKSVEDLARVADKTFMSTATARTKLIYAEILGATPQVIPVCMCCFFGL